MNKYELAVILGANLEEDERNAVLEQVKGFITRFGGQVGEVEDGSKKKLAYEIKGQTEAFYYFVQFEAENSVPGQVEAELRLLENVLRFLVVKKEA